MSPEGPPGENQKPYMPSPEEYLSSLPGSASGGHVQMHRRHRQRPIKKQRIWLRVVLFLILMAIVAAIGYVVYIASIVAKVSTNPVSFAPLSGDTSGRVNILVLGVGDPGHAGQDLSDTLMVISLDTRNNRIAQISIPRDLRVKIPGYGYAKINEANSDGGVQLAEQTVSNTLNIPIHYYVKTNFSGLKGIVDAVGGIDVDVKQRLYDPEYPCDNNQYVSCGLDIEPGQQHMDGTKALQYVRCRKGTCGDDFGRAARQQEVLNLVRAKVAKWDVILNPAKLTPIIQALRNGVETDMDALQLGELATAWQNDQKNSPVNLVLSLKAGGYLTSTSTSDLVPADGDFTAIQDRVENIFSSNP